ncbi:MAG: hypothetical protein AB8B56_18055 [Crocinitomicaceae bacterium]
MSTYKEIVLPLVEEKNAKAFRTADLLGLVGLIVLGCSLGLLQIGTFRTVSVILALILIAAPFLLRFLIDKHRKIGVIRFSNNEILTKLKDEEPIIFEIGALTAFEYQIVDYEGETKASDLGRTSSSLNVRSGSENSVYWKMDQTEFQYQFKLRSEVEKRKALYFLKSIENEV